LVSKSFYISIVIKGDFILPHPLPFRVNLSGWTPLQPVEFLFTLQWFWLEREVKIERGRSPLS